MKINGAFFNNHAGVPNSLFPVKMFSVRVVKCRNKNPDARRTALRRSHRCALPQE